MKRLLLVTDALHMAGSEVWLAEILPRLQSFGFASTVFLPKTAALELLIKRLLAAQIGVVTYNRLEEVLKSSSSFDLRLVQCHRPGTYFRLLPQMPQPSAVIIHDQIDYYYLGGLRYWYRFDYAVSKGLWIRWANKVITISEWSQRVLQKQLLIPGVAVVQNGVDVEKFRPAEPAERLCLRAKFGFSERPVALVPARLSPEKNQRVVLQTARLCPEWDFLLVGQGKGAYAESVRALAHTISNVTLWNRFVELNEVYRAVDAMLFPTLAENQSLAVLEALASGLPVVSSPIPAQAEIIRHESEGLLVSPTPQANAKALNYLFKHPKQLEQMKHKARARVLRSHTLEAQALKLSQLLNTLL